MNITQREQGELDITEATLIMSKKVIYEGYTSEAFHELYLQMYHFVILFDQKRYLQGICNINDVLVESSAC
jgi:hypothetical protein